MEDGQYKEAIETFYKLGKYKDSVDKIYSIYQKLYGNAGVGEYIKFGAYEQDNNEENGVEEIEWLVLERQGNKILIISKYALACAAYNLEILETNGCRWHNCSLREWLNYEFINDAFSETEKAMIQRTTVSADKNPKYSTDPGNTTTDKVFLLSVNEAMEYFDTNSARKCELTEYAAAIGRELFDKNVKNAPSRFKDLAPDEWQCVNGTGNCKWWLRTTGESVHDTTCVEYTGNINYSFMPYHAYSIHEFYSFYEYYGVRPAVWIDMGA